MPLWSSHSCACEQDGAGGQGCGGRGRWALVLLPNMWNVPGKKGGGRGGHIPTGKTTRDFPLQVTCLSRREAFMHISTANTEDGENPPNAFILCLVHGSQGAQNSLILSRRILPNSCLLGWRLHIHRQSLEVCGPQRQLFGRCAVHPPSPALCKPSAFLRGHMQLFSWICTTLREMARVSPSTLLPYCYQVSWELREA